MRRGMTKMEVLIAVVCSVIVIVLAGLILVRPRHGSVMLKDATLLRTINQSFIIAASEHEDYMLTPARAMRQMTPEPTGEDHTAMDVTASLYSLHIMQNYVSPDMLCSPAEPSRLITAMGRDEYDFEIYAPATGVLWDPAFTADLQTGSHTSYAHLALSGERMVTAWRGARQRFPVLSNRGPSDGRSTPESLTLRIHEPHTRWLGHVCHSDNSILLMETMTPDWLRVDIAGTDMPDNIFRMEDGPWGDDAILSFTSQMEQTGPVLQHD